MPRLPFVVLRKVCRKERIRLPRLRKGTYTTLLTKLQQVGKKVDVARAEKEHYIRRRNCALEIMGGGRKIVAVKGVDAQTRCNGAQIA